eukprot:Platyproteum_vivax@DN3742_c0_g1_i1.p1
MQAVDLRLPPPDVNDVLNSAYLSTAEKTCKTMNMTEWAFVKGQRSDDTPRNDRNPCWQRDLSPSYVGEDYKRKKNEEMSRMLGRVREKATPEAFALDSPSSRRNDELWIGTRDRFATDKARAALPDRLKVSPSNRESRPRTSTRLEPPSQHRSHKSPSGHQTNSSNSQRVMSPSNSSVTSSTRRRSVSRNGGMSQQRRSSTGKRKPATSAKSNTEAPTRTQTAQKGNSSQRDQLRKAIVSEG